MGRRKGQKNEKEEDKRKSKIRKAKVSRRK